MYLFFPFSGTLASFVVKYAYLCYTWGFIQIHQGHIHNLDRIRAFSDNFSQKSFQNLVIKYYTYLGDPCFIYRSYRRNFEKIFLIPCLHCHHHYQPLLYPTAGHNLFTMSNDCVDSFYRSCFQKIVFMRFLDALKLKTLTVLLPLC